MLYKQFQDIQISTLGLGSLRFPLEEGSKTRIDRSAAQRVIDCALGNGINYVDTAYTYNKGDAEVFLGEALKSHPRDSYLLASKFYVKVTKDIRSVFEEQLRRCQTDYFDFYLFHSLDEKCIDLYTDQELDYLGYLQEQKKNGRIRYLGFSSHAQPDTLERFLQWFPGFDMAQIQANYLDWKILDAKKQYEILEKYGIPTWIMEPLKGGRLVNLSPDAAAILKEAEPEASLASWSFRFLMGQPNIQTVLSGMSTVEQVEENVRIFSEMKPLNEEELKILQKAADIFVKKMGVPCSACRYCCETCPAGLDIPQLIKGYNEYCISGETWKVSGAHSFTKGPSECLGCGACERHCPQRIHIPEIMRRFAEVL